MTLQEIYFLKSHYFLPSALQIYLQPIFCYDVMILPNIKQ